LLAQMGKFLKPHSRLVLKTVSGKAPACFAITIDGASLVALFPDPTFGNLPTVALPPTFSANLYSDHTLSVIATGALAPKVPQPGDTTRTTFTRLAHHLHRIIAAFSYPPAWRSDSKTVRPRNRRSAVMTGK